MDTLKNIRSNERDLKFTSGIIETGSENRGSVVTDRRVQTEMPGPAKGSIFLRDLQRRIEHSVW